MPPSEIDYAVLLQRALRSVVQAVLARTAAEGLPGDHHFYLTLRMDAPGVEAPPFVRQRHPEEMTVVIQHQYEGLHVDGDGFTVTLRFDGMPARLVVPWDAVVAFFDPTAEFGLRFDVVELAGKGGRAGRASGPTPVDAPAASAGGEPVPAEAEAPPTPAPAEPGERQPTPAGEGENGKVLTFGRPRDRRGEE